MMKKRLDKIIFVVSGACLCLLLAYGYGFLTASFKFFPYYRLAGATSAAFEKYGLTLSQLVFSEKHDRYPFTWFPTKETTTGVVLHERGRTSPGLTFFCDGPASAVVIDMNGRILHRWQKDFHEVWPQPDHVDSYLPSFCDEMIRWIRARLFPDGSIIAIYTGGFSPYGGGVVKLDANSNLIWKVAVNAHHDLDIAPDGRIFVLTHKYDTGNAARSRLDDYLLILSPNGKIIKEISLLRAIQGSPYQHLIPEDFHGDYLHTNSVELFSSALAEDFPFLRSGDILLSHLTNGAITVLDKETFTVKWALTGVSRHIHDADFLTGGRIAYFNNYWQYAQGGVGSRIVEWDCLNHRLVWEFTPVDFAAGLPLHIRRQDTFFTLGSGSQQKLPNGNYLITESTGGTLLEITPDKKVVWKYVNSRFDGKSIQGVYGAKRYTREELPFLPEAVP